jgi:hypothetical protein
VAADLEPSGRLPAAAPEGLRVLPQRALFDGRPASAGVPGSAVLTGARNDAEVIEAWVQARAGSSATAKSYRRRPFASCCG